MTLYELLYIVPAPFTEKDLPNISKKITQIISDLGGKITQEKNLGSKKLAYPIKHVHRGFYVLINFEIEPEKIKELDQKLKLTSEILRYMTVKTVLVKERPPKKPSEKPPEKKEGEKEIKEIKKQKIPKKIVKEKTEKDRKVDLKKLGEKIDKLLKI